MDTPDGLGAVSPPRVCRGYPQKISKEHEAEIARQSALLRATIEGIDQRLGVFDPRRRLVISNGRFFGLLGLPRALARPGTPVTRVIRRLAAADGAISRDRVRELDEFCRG